VSRITEPARFSRLLVARRRYRDVAALRRQNAIRSTAVRNVQGPRNYRGEKNTWRSLQRILCVDAQRHNAQHARIARVDTNTFYAFEDGRAHCSTSRTLTVSAVLTVVQSVRRAVSGDSLPDAIQQVTELNNVRYAVLKETASQLCLGLIGGFTSLVVPDDREFRKHYPQWRKSDTL